jgi:hypothetical protein
VKTEVLPQEMSDGQNDYRITLTDKGKAFVERGSEFVYYNMDI